MTLKEIVELAAVMLQMEDVLESPCIKEGAPYVYDPSDRTGVAINQLKRCADLVIRQTAAEYVPLIYEESAEATGKRLYYTALSRPVVDILWVRDGSGAKQKYKVFPDCLHVEKESACVVRYTYEPRIKTLEEETDYGCGMPARTLAYGVAAEYCLISGLFEEAAMWDKRYKDSLRNLTQDKNTAIKRRGWY